MRALPRRSQRDEAASDAANGAVSDDLVHAATNAPKSALINPGYVIAAADCWHERPRSGPPAGGSATWSAACADATELLRWQRWSRRCWAGHGRRIAALVQPEDAVDADGLAATNARPDDASAAWITPHVA